MAYSCKIIITEKNRRTKKWRNGFTAVDKQQIKSKIRMTKPTKMQLLQIFEYYITL